MLYVGFVLEIRLGVNSIIDNVVTSDLIRMCIFGSAPAIVDSVVTSDLIRMCVFGSALYHCHNWRERYVSLCRMHRLCRVVRPDYVMCVQFLFKDVIIIFPRQTCVYVIK